MDEPSNLAVVVQKAYDWNVWLHPHVHKFPRDHRFSLGQHLLDSSLSLLMNLVDAMYTKRNAHLLAAAMKDVNRLRYLFRLSKDLRSSSGKSYEFAARSLDEIGRMTGGWWKSASGNRRTQDEGP